MARRRQKQAPHDEQKQKEAVPPPVVPEVKTPTEADLARAAGRRGAEPQDPPIWLDVSGRTEQPVRKVLPDNPARPLANPMSAEDFARLVRKHGAEILSDSEGMDLGSPPYSDAQVRQILMRAQEKKTGAVSPELSALRFNPAVSALVRAHGPDHYAPAVASGGKRPSFAAMPAYLHELIEEKAAKYGVDPDTMKAICRIESGGKGYDPNAANPWSQARGIWQFIPKTAAQYGMSPDERFDPEKSTDAAARYIRDNKDFLRRKLGREPTRGEEYFAYQQGPEGARQALENPDSLAVSILGIRAVLDNGGFVLDTCSQFAARWTSKIPESSMPSVGIAAGPRPTVESVYGINFATNDEAAKNRRPDPGKPQPFHGTTGQGVTVGRNLVYGPVKVDEREAYEQKLRDVAGKKPEELTQQALTGLHALGYLKPQDKAATLQDKTAHAAMNRFRKDVGLPEQKKPSAAPGVTEAAALETYANRVDTYAARQIAQKADLADHGAALDLKALMPRAGETAAEKAARDAAAPKVKALKYALMEAGTLAPETKTVKTGKGKKQKTEHVPVEPTGEVDLKLADAVAAYQRQSGLDPTCATGTEKVPTGKTKSGKPVYGQRPAITAGVVDPMTMGDLSTNLVQKMEARKSPVVAGLKVDESTLQALGAGPEQISAIGPAKTAAPPAPTVAKGENLPPPTPEATLPRETPQPVVQQAPAPVAPAVASATPTPAPTASVDVAQIWSGTARFGHGQNPEVKKIQELGDALGFGPHLGPKGADGYWGGDTTKMLKAAAKELGVAWKPGEDPGAVVAAMQAEMAKRVAPVVQGDPASPLATSFANVVANGGIRYNPRAKKPEVEAVQTMLHVLDYPLAPKTPDGYYGQNVEANLADFARKEKVARNPRTAPPELLQALQREAQERLAYFGIPPTQMFGAIAPPAGKEEPGVSLDPLKGGPQVRAEQQPVAPNSPRREPG